ncbi:amidohydrolase family protein [Paenibacillus whitsoniae]|uniref:Amidohydrolase-related domain-containing protein n=1 Tax=Paenibacillus whitsoniae TaxID=2496558 RepID=A0A3S0BRE0_9BACL|nr:amidohydrolase family protein [Paenibacillus whitsoniae]RTE04313.1 hypothetical protein EJQ19_26750 [Paenibacillus whitsoniae]
MFGPERVMFGSDWPVCQLAADYDQVMKILLNAIPRELGETERALLFGGNDERFYKLNKGGQPALARRSRSRLHPEVPGA